MNTYTLPQIPSIASVTDLRYKTKRVVESVEAQGKTVLLTRDSDPVAVLLPVGLYEAIRQYLEDVEDERDVQSMKAVLARKEKTSDFAALDRSMRKTFHLPPYVRDRSSK